MLLLLNSLLFLVFGLRECCKCSTVIQQHNLGQSGALNNNVLYANRKLMCASMAPPSSGCRQYRNLLCSHTTNPIALRLFLLDIGAAQMSIIAPLTVATTTILTHR
ncbi:hypothetical protein CGRA01v4_04701 [Colletotrichum graminicola]|nr:hypothetical protein CGRA01v4_04701 [Colletotrichum graminicola]